MYLIILIYAISIGSFLNVCIYRIPRGISIVFPRSFCPTCQHPLKWYDLVPALSFLCLRGHCRNCKAPISMQYPLVEIGTAILGLLLYIKLGLSIEFFKESLFCSLLMIIAWIDYYHHQILNRLSILGIVIGLIVAIPYGRDEFFHALLGMATGGCVLLPVAYFYPQGMGMGDVKFLAMIGSFLGVKGVLLTLFLGSALGTVIGLFLIGCKVISRKTKIPFGPFLAAGAVFVLLFIM
jgi:leader peptidase (prepilin peptidase) / N-methyltransferase